MARRIDKLQINALNAGNNQILVAREGELAFDDASNIFVGGATDAGFANISLESNLANVALEANVANTVLSISNFTTDDLNEGSANLYFTNARVLAALEGQDINLNDVTIYGDLTVQGNTTTLNTSTLAVEDKTILIASGAADAAAADNSGIVIDGAQANILYQNTGDRFSINKNIQVTGNVIASDSVVANSFASSGFGVPTIESATNIVLTANGTNGGAVVIQDSALRLRSYDDGAIANLTASAGDAIFNSSINKAQIYDGTNWANVESFNPENVTSNIIPAEGNVYSLGSPDKPFKDLFLSSNTLYLGDVRLSGSNSKLVVDFLEANIINVTNPSIYSSGRGISISQSGVISTSADDSELYDVGIDQSFGYGVTNSLEVALDYPNTNAFPALVYSFTLTNIAPSAPGISNVTITYREPGGNVIYAANGLNTSYGNVIEFINKEEVINPGTTISIKADANNRVYSSFVYKTLDDISYNKFYSNLITSGSFTTILSSQAPGVIESLKVFNLVNSDIPVTVLWLDENDTIKSYFASNVSVPAKGYRELFASPKRISSGDKISIANFSGQNNAATAMLSIRNGETYTITPSTTTINEGESVTFLISTVNVPSFSTRYYRTVANSGIISSSDFEEANAGPFFIVDNGANITLTAVEDLSDIPEDDSFYLEILSGSISGAVLKRSSDIVVIKDTSNIISFSSSSTPASIYETEEAVITINTINAVGSPGGTVYYTITGNADIYSNTSGAIEINNNTANLSLIADASVPVNEEREFTVQIRRDSISGTIIGTTSNIIVKPIPEGLVGISATGGTITEIEI